MKPGPPSAMATEAQSRSPIRPLLTLQAMRLAWHTQRAVHAPLPLAIRQLNDLRWLPRNANTADALAATRRAARLLAHLGHGSRCLHDALVLATLLSDRPGVAIHLGFRHKAASGIPDADGHAWVTVGDLTLLQLRDGLGEYVESTCHPVTRHTT